MKKVVLVSFLVVMIAAGSIFAFHRWGGQDRQRPFERDEAAVHSIRETMRQRVDCDGTEECGCTETLEERIAAREERRGTFECKFSGEGHMGIRARRGAQRHGVTGE